MADGPPTLPTLPRPKSFAKNQQKEVMLNKDEPTSESAFAEQEMLANEMTRKDELGNVARMIRKQQIAMGVCCVIQLFMSFAIISAAGDDSDESLSDTERFFVKACGFIALFSCLCGAAGVAMMNRNFLLFFYINQLWSLANICTVLLTNMQESARQEDTYCEENGQEGLAMTCEEAKAKASGKLMATFMCLFVLWVSAYIGQSLSEKIQDRENLEIDIAMKTDMLTSQNQILKRMSALESYVANKLPKEGPQRATKQPSFPRQQK